MELFGLIVVLAVGVDHSMAVLDRVVCRAALADFVVGRRAIGIKDALRYSYELGDVDRYS